MLLWLAAIGAALVLAAVHYARRDSREGRRALWPAVLRALAVLLLAAAVLDAPAGQARGIAPFAAIDVSASWLRGADSAQWRSAVNRVRAAGADTVFLT